jgi:hypothetical protein
MGATGQPRSELVATVTGRFAVPAAQAELEFVKSSGATEKVILHQNGKDSPGNKVE